MNVPSLKPLAIVAGIALALGACSQKPAETESATTPAAESAAATTAEPAHVAFDTSELDPSINVCADLNGFVNNKWLAANPIPADKTRWGTFDVLREASLKTQHEIAEAAANSNAAAGSIEQKGGALYKAGMDEAAELQRWLADQLSRGLGSLFYFGAETDFKNSQRKIAYAFQGGLGLPTPDYYQKDEHAKIRDAYLAHIAKVLELTGVDSAAASKQAAAVLAFETALAKESLPPVELRNPENQYHFVSIADADKVTPHFEWGAFFKAQNADVTDGFSLSQPKFFAQMDKMLASTPVADWQAYLRFQYADKVSPYLSAPFQQEHFAFHKPEKDAPNGSSSKPRRARWTWSTTCRLHSRPTSKTWTG